MPAVTDKSARSKKNEKPVLHPELLSLIFDVTHEGELSVDIAKELLGYEEEPEGEKWKDKYDVIVGGKKVRLTHNSGNRPYYPPLAEGYAQEMLNGRWRLNGETITTTKTGQLASGAHRLMGLIIAEDRRQSEEHWTERHPEPLTFPAIVIYGIEDEDDVINTIDTGKSRTPADMIYRSEIFRGMKSKARQEAARALDFAVRIGWDRTGSKDDPYAPRQTHSEVMDFIARHPGLVKSVKKILDVNKEQGLNQFIKAGTASGLHYLMGASQSNRDKYFGTVPHVEKKADWSDRSKADAFFEDLAKGGKKTIAVMEEIGHLANSKDGISNPQRIAILILAYQVWRTTEGGKKIEREDLRIKYKTTETGKKLVMPCIGGIDLGSREDQKQFIRDKQTAANAVTAESNGEAVETEEEPVVEELTEIEGEEASSEE